MKKPQSVPRTYADAVKRWLAGYNQTVLKAKTPGDYTYRQGDIRHYFYILTEEKSYENIFPESRRHVKWLKKSQLKIQLKGEESQSISLHRYFHHLNSSQALCLNLFLPLIHEGKVNWVLEHCEKISLPSGNIDARFEEESKKEIGAKSRNSRKTSFDFFVEWNKKDRPQQVLVEVKYSEQGFGGAKNDTAHQEKFRVVYKPMLKQARPFFRENKQIDCPEFLRNYQILRNLVHIRENSHVVFLVPRGNKPVVTAVKDAMDIYLSTDGRKRCHLVFLEDFLDDLLVKTKGTDLETHFRKFESRYFPPEIRSFGASPA